MYEKIIFIYFQIRKILSACCVYNKIYKEKPMTFFVFSSANLVILTFFKLKIILFFAQSVKICIENDEAQQDVRKTVLDYDLRVIF